MLGGNQGEIASTHGGSSLAFKTEGELRQTFPEMLEGRNESTEGDLTPLPILGLPWPGGRQTTRVQTPVQPAAQPPHLMPKSLHL